MSAAELGFDKFSHSFEVLLFYFFIATWCCNLLSFWLRCGTRPYEWAPNETWTHLWMFASLVCYLLHHQRRFFVCWCSFPISPSTLIFLFSKRSDSFLIWQFYSISYMLSSTFHYKHGTFFSAKFNSYLLAVNYCLYQSFIFFKQLHIVHVHKVINLFLWFYKFLAPSAPPKY